MRAAAVALVTGLTLAGPTAPPASAEPLRPVCDAAAPGVNKPGFRPGQIVAYALLASPGGEAFPADMVACVERAFDAWSTANLSSGLDVRFIAGAGGIGVRFDKPGGLALPPRRAGAWNHEVRGADGALERALIWLSGDRALMEACEAVTKVMLHELGHLHGLADNEGADGPSVMNRARGKDDRGGWLPTAPTRCDARQARRAAVTASQ